MVRVWKLMFIYQTTAEKVFNECEWYSMGQQLRISLERYKFLIRKLGDDAPQLDVYVTNENDENVADRIWGGLHQHNDFLEKMERHFSEIGKNFIVTADNWTLLSMTTSCATRVLVFAISVFK